MPLTEPKCALNLYPVNGDDDLGVQLSLEWNVDPTEDPLLPVGFLLYFGTDYPPTNIYNGEDVAELTSFNTPPLNVDQLYYWKVFIDSFIPVRNV